MKHFVRHIVCLALASYFLVAGCGFNVAHYCCEACAEHGMRMFTAAGCCDEVHHNHSHHEHASAHCCEHHHGDGFSTAHNACTLQRLATDISTLDCQHIDVAPAVVWCETILADAPLLPTVDENCAQNLTSHAPPLLCTGRIVLSRIATLLI